MNPKLVSDNPLNYMRQAKVASSFGNISGVTLASFLPIF
jgi:hypothetical protein